jgi:hypothetical protein
VLVYRVETFDKRGAYTSCVALGVGRSEDHPTPCDDLILKEWWNDSALENWYFGFCSMEQLIQWFPKDDWGVFIKYNSEIDSKRRVGISIYECSDEDVRVGEKQTVFILDKAERIRILAFEDELVA